MSKLIGNGADRPFEDIERNVIGRLHGGNLQKHALGLGTGKSGTDAGRSNAVYADIDLTSVPDLTNVIVGHALGKVPRFCELVAPRNSGATVYAQVTPVKPETWTHSTCRVAVSLTGTQSGTVLKFRVGGE